MGTRLNRQWLTRPEWDTFVEISTLKCDMLPSKTALTANSSSSAARPRISRIVFPTKEGTVEFATMNAKARLDSTTRVSASNTARPTNVALNMPVKMLLSCKRRSEEHTSELQSQSNLVCR